MSEPITPDFAKPEALDSLAVAPSGGTVFCRSCGKSIQKTALSCPHCGEPTTEPKAQKSKLISLLLTAGLLVLLVGGGFAASIFYPQYEASREQSRKYEIVTISQLATAKVEKYFREKGGVPKTLEEAGSNSKPATSTVKSMVVHPEKGTITIVLNYGRADGKSLLYTPTIDDKQIISWNCTTKDVPEKMLPPGCTEEVRN
ncbi:MAG: pilin [Burkholderiales bacterium]